MEAFVAEMGDRGWLEGKHFVIERRITGSNLASAPELARELVNLKVDVILTVVSGNAVAARRASSQIPIVMVTGGFPVEAGLVKSLGKPGGNVTGTTSHGSPELFGKYVELLRTLAPRAARIGVLWDYLPPAVTQPEADAALDSMRRASRALELTVRAREVRSVADVRRAVAQFSTDGIGALHVTSGPIHAQADAIAILTEFTRRRRVPALSDFAGSGFFVQGGSVLAYSANPPALGRRAAYFVDRILRGASPSELPLEQPIKFDLSINLVAVKALGITVPPALLQRADKLIE
jgi:putative ABC transport system substrate-binding protein